LKKGRRGNQEDIEIIDIMKRDTKPEKVDKTSTVNKTKQEPYI
jgi:hypothetical protein